ncbi:MAG: hypothetical protein ACI4XS_14580 [Bacillus sp. (in: firmicutes)]
MRNNNAAGTIIGAFVYAIFSLCGLYATIMSSIYTFSAYKHGNEAGMIIWFVLGLFMLFWCIYFSRELFQLIKTKE